MPIAFELLPGMEIIENYTYKVYTIQEIHNKGITDITHKFMRNEIEPYAWLQPRGKGPTAIHWDHVEDIKRNYSLVSVNKAYIKKTRFELIED